MRSRKTRSSANNQRPAASVNELELNDSTNMNASENGIEANVEASVAAESETPTGGASSSNVKRKKRRTSKVWQHYTDDFVEEKVGDMVTQKAMAACKYCSDVLCASSSQDPRNVTSLLDDLSDLSINDDKVDQDGGSSTAADHIVDDDDIVEPEED
ncbi:unnamed protein product [Urochloa humidicola]